jgi:hypothetical protein
MNEDELKEYLKENLSIYTGGMGGPLYEDSHTIQLILDGEVISEDHL